MAQAKTVVVTGASAGIGRAVVRRFAEDGASVGLIGRSEAGLAGARRAGGGGGGRACAAPADFADARELESAAETIEGALGPIDIWVNNAMTTVFAFFEDIEPDEYRRGPEGTYLGTGWGAPGGVKRIVPSHPG